MTPPIQPAVYLIGDPIDVAPDVTSIGALLTALGPEAPPQPGLLGLAPGVALIHSLTETEGRLTLRWIHLRHQPSLARTEDPVEAAVLLRAPIRESGHALQVVSRLRACLRDPMVIEQARPAATREELAQALAVAEQPTGASALSGAEALALLASGPAGLTDAEARRRLGSCGPNHLERVRRRPLMARFLEQFTSFFAVLLWVGAAIALLARMPELAWAIVAVIVINGVFSFWQEYEAERAVEALARLLPHQIAVIRNATEHQVPTEALVPGDLVQLEAGDQVPADSQLLAAETLRVDQSTLTGESRLVSKLPTTSEEPGRVPVLERHELIFAGTSIASGAGTAVVCATGMTTEIGAIAHLTQSVVEEPSPLQREITRVTRIVTFLAASCGVGFFALGVSTRVMRPTEGFIFALGIIVANVPEGLLPTLTLALALGVQRMARQGSLMKRLSAVETLGAVTVICADKTGTLTENRMAVRFIWVAGRVLAMDAVRECPAEVTALFEAATLASQATLEHGDPMEIALLVGAATAGVVPETVRREQPLLAPYPFDSFRKRMTLVRRTDRGAVAYVKGAAKETLGLCTSIDQDGQPHPLAEPLRRAILAEHDRMAAQGLRLLAVACRPMPDALIGAPLGAVERDLTFLGLVALWDPVRPEVPEAVALCQRAGVRVVMVTGDYGLTAQAIARQIGLPVDKVISGAELEGLPPEALRRILQEPGVLFARTSPTHKLTIVSTLKALGEIVAVTGDGVNDAPALKAAAIGVAMGQRGSDVAKEAAEMVITDDNFASIVAGVRQGRAIYANVGKFIVYIFTHNFAELVAFLAFVFLRIPLPLTVMQVLAVDLGTDLFPALALGAEPPEPAVMDQPPRPRQERLLGARRLLRAYGFLGMVEAALALGAFGWTYWVAGWRPGAPLAGSGALYQRATTMTLAGIVAAQIGNLFACRTDRESVFRVGLLTNRLVLWGVGAELGILLGLILIPPLAAVFSVAPLRVAEWWPLLGFPAIMLGAEEVRKYVIRRVGRPRA